jgi:hypothetical protein
MLANFKWWRKFKGGMWWHVRLKNMWDEPTFWINTKPVSREESFWFEDYTNVTVRNSNEDNTFYQSIVNLEWRDKTNLISIAIRAKQLKELGVPDEIIISTFATTMFIGREEFTLRDYPPQTIDMKELINAIDY